MAMTQTDLDTAIKNLSDLITGEDTSIADIITQVTALISKIQAGATPADLTTEVTAIQATAADVSTQMAALAASIAAAKPISGV